MHGEAWELPQEKERLGMRCTCDVDADVGAISELGGLSDSLLQGRADVGAVLRNVQHVAGLHEAHATAHLSAAQVRVSIGNECQKAMEYESSSS